MSGVSGKVALVTGCGSAEGIGFATARALAAAGARVAIAATGPRIHDRLADLGPGHAAFTAIRACLPAMQAAGYGWIVNVASVTGPLVSIERTAGYAAAKAAMCGLTRTVALENARHGIACNAVLPGWIATGSATAREIAAGRRSPAGRPGRPEEVAACCLFLAREGASYVNGAMLVAHGANSIVEMK